MAKQEYKVNPKYLRKIAIDKFGCNVVASLDDEEVRNKIMKDFVLIQEINTTRVYLIAKSQLSECISIESEK